MTIFFMLFAFAVMVFVALFALCSYVAFHVAAKSASIAQARSAAAGETGGLALPSAFGIAAMISVPAAIIRFAPNASFFLKDASEKSIAMGSLLRVSLQPMLVLCLAMILVLGLVNWEKFPLKAPLARLGMAEAAILCISLYGFAPSGFQAALARMGMPGELGVLYWVVFLAPLIAPMIAIPLMQGKMQRIASSIAFGLCGVASFMISASFWIF